MAAMFKRMWDRLVEHHRCLGPITLYPFDSAMHGAINIRTRLGFLCVQPPSKHWGWYVYLSPNATPWASTWYVGTTSTRFEKRMAGVRRALWGHGYSTNAHSPIALREAIEWRFGGVADREEPA